MPQQYTNLADLPLAAAVWLAKDTYDHTNDTHLLSATTLLRSPRQLVLESRIPASKRVPDITEVVKSRIGTAIHDAIERAWLDDPQASLLALGHHPDDVAAVLVNPQPEDLFEHCVPVYMERRSSKTIDGYTISGKFDFVADGVLTDFKSTSSFVVEKGVKVEDYQLQGSVYRWLNPDIITADYMHIVFVVTDWSRGRAAQSARNLKSKYPQNQIHTIEVPLLSLEDTEKWIRQRLGLFAKAEKAETNELPECSDKELWRGETTYKYYKDPSRARFPQKNRSNGTFGPGEGHLARQKMADDGFVGVVVEIPGKVMACNYCACRVDCRQYERLQANGEIADQ